MINKRAKGWAQGLMLFAAHSPVGANLRPDLRFPCVQFARDAYIFWNCDIASVPGSAEALRNQSGGFRLRCCRVGTRVARGDAQGTFVEGNRTRSTLVCGCRDFASVPRSAQTVRDGNGSRGGGGGQGRTRGARFWASRCLVGCDRTRNTLTVWRFDRSRVPSSAQTVGHGIGAQLGRRGLSRAVKAGCGAGDSIVRTDRAGPVTQSHACHHHSGLLLVPRSQGLRPRHGSTTLRGNQTSSSTYTHP